MEGELVLLLELCNKNYMVVSTIILVVIPIRFMVISNFFSFLQYFDVKSSITYLILPGGCGGGARSVGGAVRKVVYGYK